LNREIGTIEFTRLLTLILSSMASTSFSINMFCLSLLLYSFTLYLSIYLSIYLIAFLIRKIK
jgi:hypothetical protein